MTLVSRSGRPASRLGPFGGFVDALARGFGARTAYSVPLSLDDWAQMFLSGGFPVLRQSMQGSSQEEIDGQFASLVDGAYKSNGIVFACMLTRMMLFSEARFQFQRLRNGRPGELFGTEALRVLERPQRGRTTGDLLSRFITDADLAGTAFVIRRPGDRLVRIRPDWVTMVFLSAEDEVDPDAQVPLGDLDAEFAGIIYHPGGRLSGEDPQTYSWREVAYFAPVPDPLASWRGMSWLTPVIREIMGDSAATSHKLQFFESAATPNMVIRFEPGIEMADAKEWIDLFEQEHGGVMNAYRTAYLGGGASGEVVGLNFRDMDYRQIQGAGETRIAAASGVHPVIAALSEGLAGSSLNAGNFSAARRLVADRTLRPLWRNAAGSLEAIIDVPSDARLWYDDRDVPFLQDDVADAAAVLSIHASAIRQLLDAGFESDRVVEAVTGGDLTLLKGQHSGLFSVQLQPPGSELAPSSNGSGSSNGQGGRALPVTGAVRCQSCGSLLAELVTAPYRFRCRRCKAENVSPELAGSAA